MAELLSVRSSIDNIDATLVYLLAERFKATQRVGHLKAEHDLPAGDPQREAAQIARLRMLAEEAQLDPAFAEKFLNFIISEVIRHHQAISENRKPAADPTQAPAASSAASSAAGHPRADASGAERSGAQGTGADQRGADPHGADQRSAGETGA
jgi:chorismate mutase